jgi:hypothetical protein
MASEKKRKLHKKLRIKLWIFGLIFLVSFVLSFYQSITDTIPYKTPILGFCFGLLIGAITSRIQNVTWDEKGEQIITDLDWIGGIILISNIAFLYFKRDIIHLFIHLPHISAIVFAINSGVMLGRILTMRHQIKTILREKITEE